MDEKVYTLKCPRCSDTVKLMRLSFTIDTIYVYWKCELCDNLMGLNRISYTDVFKGVKPN